MTSNAASTPPLLHADKLTLHIPIIRPKDRQLLSNPARFLTDLYFSRTNRDVVTILDKVSFTLNQGERIGIIGANGAGKSTLLRMLAGIYAPSSGTLEVNGTVKGLFSISLGMYPEATGLENIYMRGLQMGLKLQEIKEMVPEVVEFAELQDAIENPMNTYSSGMRTRLAFSISTMIEPDILLLDEWIGAGDARFRDKVQARMNRLVEDSRGMVLATHNTGLMKKLCTKGLVLSKGKMAYYGDLEEALDIYANDKKLQTRL